MFPQNLLAPSRTGFGDSIFNKVITLNESLGWALVQSSQQHCRKRRLGPWNTHKADPVRTREGTASARPGERSQDLPCPPEPWAPSLLHGGILLWQHEQTNNMGVYICCIKGYLFSNSNNISWKISISLLIRNGTFLTVKSQYYLSLLPRILFYFIDPSI